MARGTEVGIGTPVGWFQAGQSLKHRPREALIISRYFTECLVISASTTGDGVGDAVGEGLAL